MKAAKTRKKDSDKVHVILYFIIITCNQVEYASTVYTILCNECAYNGTYGCVMCVSLCNVTLKYRKLSEELRDRLGLVSI